MSLCRFCCWRTNFVFNEDVRIVRYNNTVEGRTLCLRFLIDDFSLRASWPRAIPEGGNGNSINSKYVGWLVFFCTVVTYCTSMGSPNRQTLTSAIDLQTQVKKLRHHATCYRYFRDAYELACFTATNL